ncbi:MAG: MogA/MoaB family molybdenum cofactor biosynthesis protein [Deltaproteobacteria bacterium]|nr:MogA/MoaB family molybdenum cofactor biosynthesis protein [Deltaproteobacteria bacterium]
MKEAEGSRDTGAVNCLSRTAAVITVSDRGARGDREDVSGKLLCECLTAEGYSVEHYGVVPDEGEAIARILRHLADDRKTALILTTGGTGVAPRDVTPEATLSVVERVVPGMAEAMRQASLAKTPHAMISRGVAGIRGRSLIVNLPGSPRGAVENLQVILPALLHALKKIQGDPSDCAEV